MKEIVSISVDRLNNGAHFQFMSLILARAENDQTVSQKAAKYVTAFKTALQQEDECLKISQKSLLTDKITVADSMRDKVFALYRKSVKGYLSFPLEEKTEAAKILNQHILDYAISPKMQLDKQTGLLVNLLSDLDGKYKEQVETLALSAVVASLKDANNQVISLTEQRTVQRMTKNVGALKAARAESDNAYRLLVRMVNALIIVEESTVYDDFADYVNTQITHYKREAMGTKAATTKTSSKPSSNNGNNGSDGGTTGDGSGNSGNTGDTGSSGSGSGDNGSDSDDGDDGLLL